MMRNMLYQLSSFFQGGQRLQARKINRIHTLIDYLWYVVRSTAIYRSKSKLNKYPEVER
jgi:hypothetical protein